MFGFVVLAVVSQPPPARAAEAQSGPGGELYAQHCASCHQATGLGIEGTFPPLVGNPAAADEQYVETVIRDGLSGPLEVLGVQYDAVMPPAVELTEPSEIEELARYVVALVSPDGAVEAGGSAGPDSAADDRPGDKTNQDPANQNGATGPVVGDVDRGHELFVGTTRFENGGAACVACHTAGSVGNLGGWSLGPDLTDTFQTLGGEAGLTGWLAAPPSPTMRPIFADRLLSEAEVADVVAFLDGATQEGKADSGFDRLSVAGAVGLAVLIAGMALTWRGMRQTYVERIQSGGRVHPRASGRGGAKVLVDAEKKRDSIRSLSGKRLSARAQRSPR